MSIVQVSLILYGNMKCFIVVEMVVLIASYFNSIFRAPPFQPQPSLKTVASYLVNDCVKKFPKAVCKLCGKSALPENPQVCCIVPLTANYLRSNVLCMVLTILCILIFCI